MLPLLFAKTIGEIAAVTHRSFASLEATFQFLLG